MVGGSAVGVLAVAPSASAYPSPTVSLTGHGYGHGHGMGQWGALGYALARTGYQSIVSHYYGGSALSGLTGAQEATNLRVDLTENDGNTVIVTSGSPFSVAGTISVPAHQAVLMVPTGGGKWNLSTGAGCAGPAWTPRGTFTNPTAVPQGNPAAGDPNAATKALQLCQGGGNLTVRGTIEGTYNSLGSARTVNTLPL